MEAERNEEKESHTVNQRASWTHLPVVYQVVVFLQLAEWAGFPGNALVGHPPRAWGVWFTSPLLLPCLAVQRRSGLASAFLPVLNNFSVADKILQQKQPKEERFIWLTAQGCSP